MGMYTELRLRVTLTGLNEEARSILEYIAGTGDHERSIMSRFGPRGSMIGRGSSEYFGPPRTTFDGRELITRFNLKNYDEEIERFLDWISPYVEAPEYFTCGLMMFEDNRTKSVSYINGRLDTAPCVVTGAAPEMSLWMLGAI